MILQNIVLIVLHQCLYLETVLGVIISICC